MDNKAEQKNQRKAVAWWPAVWFLCVFLAGCSRDILDPTQIGRFRPVPVVNVILESLGVADEPEPTYAGAEDPRPEDVIAFEQDYRFGPGDVIQISIYELQSDYRMYVNRHTVTETGRISVPEVGQITAAGLTEMELEEEIRRILKPGILLDPTVMVALLASQSRIFSIFGEGIRAPSQYMIPRRNFRLSEAIALARGVREFNVSNIFISREVSGAEVALIGPEEETVEMDLGFEDVELRPIGPGGGEGLSPEEEMLEIISPMTKVRKYRRGIVIASAEMATEGESELPAPETKVRRPGGAEDKASGLRESEGLSRRRIDPGPIEWVFEDGKWIPLRMGPDKEIGPLKRREGIGFVKEPLGFQERPEAGFGWEQIGTGAKQTRVIKIPVKKLLGGDPRYDIVIRPQDRISVPADIIGECWVTGNVRGAGPVPLTGRPMTLKMLIATAGLGPLAEPTKVEVIRRLGKNKTGLTEEMTVMVDLDKIAKGLQPDFFIKPFDLVNVGTYGTSRFKAVLRNAFRASYGFGFIYDRNFAYRYLGNVYNTAPDALEEFGEIFGF